MKNYVKVVEVCFNRKMMRASQTDRNSNEHILTDVNLQEEFVTLMRIRQSTLCMHIIGRGHYNVSQQRGSWKERGTMEDKVKSCLICWHIGIENRFSRNVHEADCSGHT